MNHSTQATSIKKSNEILKKMIDPVSILLKVLTPEEKQILDIIIQQSLPTETTKVRYEEAILSQNFAEIILRTDEEHLQIEKFQEILEKRSSILATNAICILEVDTESNEKISSDLNSLTSIFSHREISYDNYHFATNLQFATEDHDAFSKELYANDVEEKTPEFLNSIYSIKKQIATLAKSAHENRARDTIKDQEKRALEIIKIQNIHQSQLEYLNAAHAKDLEFFNNKNYAEDQQYLKAKDSVLKILNCEIANFRESYCLNHATSSGKIIEAGNIGKKGADAVDDSLNALKVFIKGISKEIPEISEAVIEAVIPIVQGLATMFIFAWDAHTVTNKKFAKAFLQILNGEGNKHVYLNLIAHGLGSLLNGAGIILSTILLTSGILLAATGAGIAFAAAIPFICANLLVATYSLILGKRITSYHMNKQEIPKLENEVDEAKDTLQDIVKQIYAHNNSAEHNNAFIFNNLEEIKNTEQELLEKIKNREQELLALIESAEPQTITNYIDQYNSLQSQSIVAIQTSQKELVTLINTAPTEERQGYIDRYNEMQTRFIESIKNLEQKLLLRIDFSKPEEKLIYIAQYNALQCKFIELQHKEEKLAVMLDKQATLEHKIGFNTAEVIATSIVALGVGFGIAGYIAASVATGGILPILTSIGTGLVITGIVLGAAIKIFEAVDNHHEHKYTRGIKEFFKHPMSSLKMYFANTTEKKPTPSNSVVAETNSVALFQSTSSLVSSQSQDSVEEMNNKTEEPVWRKWAQSINQRKDPAQLNVLNSIQVHNFPSSPASPLPITIEEKSPDWLVSNTTAPVKNMSEFSFGTKTQLNIHTKNIHTKTLVNPTNNHSIEQEELVPIPTLQEKFVDYFFDCGAKKVGKLSSKIGLFSKPHGARTSDVYEAKTNLAPSLMGSA